MKIPVFYRDEQSVTDKFFSPSPRKPKLVFEDWGSKFPQLVQAPFLPLTVAQLKEAHNESLVDGVLQLRTSNGFGNRSKSVAASLPYTTGSMVAATLHALAFGGVAVSPTSGFHHAGYGFSGGYCTFNGLILAAMAACKAGANKVLILDCDAHYGNGTDDIIYLKGLSRTISNITYGDRFHNDYQQDDFLHQLSLDLEYMVPRYDVVIYQAGADPHIDDPLGGMLTTEAMRERDRMVFTACKDSGVPVAWNLAGGYQKPVEKVIELHRNTMEECITAFG